ncbi:sulfatase family protein [Neorhodopirellula pilleata]|uniref:Arylsulfatase n=1 Tax=Neorhodopirellula pilleata TaxID=2714738 RepID=A0A5C6AA12_9BACT|nr:sulfatase [Neorhodopirellula pilleata]TWT96399.1 Arylsulfatase [Neorhodopirellula pilleata]
MKFVSLAVVITFTLLLSCPFTNTVFSDDTPPKYNIVFAFADDLGRYASAYADADHRSPNDLIRTPHFDSVAAEGVLFENAFVSVPSCTPSRAAFLTGRHFFRNGSHSQLHHPWHVSAVDGAPPIDPWENVRGMGLMLDDAGYHIGWSYKMHLSEDRMGGKNRNYTVAGKAFNLFSQKVSAAEDHEAAKTKLLDEVRGNFDAFLSDRQDDQPFFYWFNPTNTHRDWVRGSGKELWGLNPDDLKGRLPKFLPDNDIIREDFADYLGEAMAFDAAVGVLIEKLKSSGQWENTMFVISGDHGAPGFPRGKCNLYDFGTRVPLAIRLPQSMQPSQQQNPVHRVATPVSLVDLAPTFLDVVGVPASQPMDGESLLPVLRSADPDAVKRMRGWVLMGRENHVDESRPGGLPYPIRAIRNEQYLFIKNFAPDRWPVAEPPLSAALQTATKKKNGGRRMDIDFGPTRTFFVEHEGSEDIRQAWDLGFARRPAEELYDVQADPDQMNNLIDSQSHQVIAGKLRSQLIRELTGSGDPRVQGEGDAFDRPPYTRGDEKVGQLAK